MQVYTDMNTMLELGAPIGSGGEADVYHVKQNPNIAAKIYKGNRITTELQKKLEYMVRNAPDDPCLIKGSISIAWPRELVYKDASKQDFMGYIMPKVENCKPVGIVYFPPDRKAKCPLFNWKYLLYTARNIASTLAALHDKNYVVGDINESNILVRETSQIVFIDTDSFQVQTPTQTYRCVVGKPEYTPAENQRNFTTFDREKSHDNFALAVLVFQLLMEGRHPFDGGVQIGSTIPEVNNLAEKIKHNYFRYAYKEKNGVEPPVSCPPFSILTPTIQELMIRCFVDGEVDHSQRPDAREWMSALDELRKNMAVCNQNPQHEYSSHVQNCPWCDRMVSLNLADPFPSPAAIAQNVKANAAKKTQKKTPIQAPQPTYTVITNQPTTNTTPPTIGNPIPVVTNQPVIVQQPVYAPNININTTIPIAAPPVAMASPQPVAVPPVNMPLAPQIALNKTALNPSNRTQVQSILPPGNTPNIPGSGALSKLHQGIPPHSAINNLLKQTQIPVSGANQVLSKQQKLSNTFTPPNVPKGISIQSQQTIITSVVLPPLSSWADESDDT